MESTQIKTVAFILVVLAIGICLGVSILKFNQAAQAPDDADAMTPVQKLEALEKCSTGTSRTTNFIQKEKTRAQETREAEKAVFE